MAKQQFEFVRLVGEERRVGPSLQSVSKHWKSQKECFLFVSPHDDDVAIGGALMILAALKEKVPVHIAIVTDGAAGYCSLKEKDTIAAIRRAETYQSFRTLGVKKANVHWLDFPDCQLANFVGRRPVVAGDPAVFEGHTGMQNAFTKLLRDIRPTQVFLPTDSDLHPDHRITYSEMMISLYHASGAIWPELGKKLPVVPYVHEMAVYCDFPTPPKLRLLASEAMFEKKLKSILDFKSQKQIEAQVKTIREAGPMEFFRPVEWKLYDPRTFYNMFEERSNHTSRKFL
ncbi:MAG: PIG-L family deacetylase [Phycisphaerae bacterium]|nr:PIG-L family deacetylase [Phycisphaerae bacterium]